MRPYIIRNLIGTGVAVLVLLCVGWPVYYAVAQANHGTLTVEECLAEGNASMDPIAEDLIKEGIIGENLLSTKVTDGMCEDVLERTPDGTPVQRFVTAQNYIQEIKLIENAIREAAGEAAAKGTDRYFLADEPLVLAATQSAAVAQYYAAPSPTGGDEAGPGGAGGGDEAGPTGGDEAGPGGGDDETKVDPIRRQAAEVSEVAAAAVAAGDASIPDVLEKIESAYFREGESRSAAVRAAHCALEQALLNAISKELSREKLIRVDPDPTPKEMGYGDTITVKLFISGAISEAYDRLERQYEKVDEASEAPHGCVHLTELMHAEVIPRRFAISSDQVHDSWIRGRITRDTTWRWDLTANTEGNNVVSLLLGHVLTRAGEELRPRWLEPAPLYANITIKPEPLAKVSNSIERNWRWLLPVGIALLTVVAALLVRVLRKDEQRRPGGPRDESGRD
jgi:hypothetical protein